MEINQGLYPAYLLASLIVGAVLGMIYDGFRILRILRRGIGGEKTDGVLSFFEDVLFFVIAAVFLSILNYAMNRGRMRWFSLLVAGIGFWIWQKTMSRVLIVSVLWIKKRLDWLYRITLGRLFGRVYEKYRLLRDRRSTNRLRMRLIRQIKCGKWN